MSTARKEVEALWSAATGEPPSVEAAPGLMLDILLRCMPVAPPYEPAIFAWPSDRPAAVVENT